MTVISIGKVKILTNTMAENMQSFWIIEKENLTVMLRSL